MFIPRPCRGRKKIILILFHSDIAVIGVIRFDINRYIVRDYWLPLLSVLQRKRLFSAKTTHSSVYPRPAGKKKMHNNSQLTVSLMIQQLGIICFYFVQEHKIIKWQIKKTPLKCQLNIIFLHSYSQVVFYTHGILILLI